MGWRGTRTAWQALSPSLLPPSCLPPASSSPRPRPLLRLQCSPPKTLSPSSPSSRKDIEQTSVYPDGGSEQGRTEENRGGRERGGGS
eukprot:747107-Hanusia_phi.AAC.2